MKLAAHPNATEENLNTTALNASDAQVKREAIQNPNITTKTYQLH